MKIALLAPAGAMHRFSGSFHKNLHYAPMTLALLASFIPAEWQWETAIFDETAGPIPLDLDADIVALTVITGTADRCYRFAEYFRSKGKTVIMGGPHPSIAPEEAAKHADAVITGLGEDSFLAALSDCRKGALRKFYHQNPETTIANRPPPRRDLLRKSAYITLNTVEAVRGCPHNCSFCVYPAAYGQRIYTRPVDEVIDEIKGLRGKFVVFPDVNLIADRKYAGELFRAMIPLRKWWFGLTTTGIHRSPELMDLFRESGCKGLLIGFESVSQSSQGAMNKHVNQVDDYEGLMRDLHERGIMVMGCFAFGSDGDDKTVFDETVRLIERAKIDLPRFSVLTPFPGTRLYEELEAADRITKRQLALYDVEHVVFRPKQMTAQELEEGLAYAWKKAYSWKSILRRLDMKKSRTVKLLFFAMNLAYRQYALRYSAFGEDVMCDNSDIPAPPESNE